jgi:hypothetical protein
VQDRHDESAAAVMTFAADPVRTKASRPSADRPTVGTAITTTIARTISQRITEPTVSALIATSPISSLRRGDRLDRLVWSVISRSVGRRSIERAMLAETLRRSQDEFVLRLATGPLLTG